MMRRGRTMGLLAVAALLGANDLPLEVVTRPNANPEPLTIKDLERLAAARLKRERRAKKRSQL